MSSADATTPIAALEELRDRFRESAFSLDLFVSDSLEHVKKQQAISKALVKKFAEAKPRTRAEGEQLPRATRKDDLVDLTVDQKTFEFLRGFVNEAETWKSEHPAMLHNMAFIYLIALFDAYLGDAYFVFFIGRPETLKSSRRQLTYEEIIERLTAGDLLESLARRETNRLERDPVSDQFARIGVRLKGAEFNLPDLIEILARRNVLVHNNGVADLTYLKKVEGSAATLGDRLDVSPDYWERAQKTLELVVTHIHSELSTKLASR